MAEKTQIETLQEQISFLEARLLRYEELAKGSAWRRWVFGGRRFYLSLAGIIASPLLTIVALIRGWGLWWLVLLLAVVLFITALRQFREVVRATQRAIFEQKVFTLRLEKKSMEGELQRLKTQAAQPGKMS